MLLIKWQHIDGKNNEGILQPRLQNTCVSIWFFRNGLKSVLISKNVWIWGRVRLITNPVFQECTIGTQCHYVNKKGPLLITYETFGPGTKCCPDSIWVQFLFLWKCFIKICFFISLECLFIVIELLLPKSPCLTICDAFCVVLGSNKNGFNRYTLNKQHILSV